MLPGIVKRTRATLRSGCGVAARRYTDQNFDTEFFSVLQRAVRICIAEAGSATLDDVVSYLRDKARTHSAILYKTNPFFLGNFVHHALARLLVAFTWCGTLATAATAPGH